MSKVVAKVKELWNQTATQFNTEEEMDNFFNNYYNISIGLFIGPNRSHNIFIHN